MVEFVAPLNSKKKLLVPLIRYTVSASGGTPEKVAPVDFDALDPTWSPDGQSLAFGRLSSTVRNIKDNAIFVVNLKSRNVTTLADSAGLFSPRWSPDGRYLLATTAAFDKLVLFDFSS